MDLLTVEEVRSRLPFKISERALRRRLRDSKLVITHRKQVALEEKLWPKFLDYMRCSSSTSAPTPLSGKSSGRALTPESALEKARAVIAKTKRARS